LPAIRLRGDDLRSRIEGAFGDASDAEAVEIQRHVIGVDLDRGGVFVRHRQIAGQPVAARLGDLDRKARAVARVAAGGDAGGMDFDDAVDRGRPRGESGR
jgi:hypothetical protein